MRKRYPVRLRTAPVHFWSKNDELSFLGWVARIPCVAAYDGTAFWEEIKIVARPANGELHDLIDLFTRYGIPLKQLAQFVDKRNESYFRTSMRDWYSAMFVDD